eukprot:6179112-Pleurochrysis_carterae.AAC.1
MLNPDPNSNSNPNPTSSPNPNPNSNSNLNPHSDPCPNRHHHLIPNPHLPHIHSGEGRVSFPVTKPERACLAATDDNFHRASFTNYGAWVDVAAPGVQILSTFLSGGYGLMSGTSMACPVISGVLGLMLSAAPGRPRQDYLDCLYQSAKDISTISSNIGESSRRLGCMFECVRTCLNAIQRVRAFPNRGDVKARGAIGWVAKGATAAWERDGEACAEALVQMSCADERAKVCAGGCVGE